MEDPRSRPVEAVVPVVWKRKNRQANGGSWRAYRRRTVPPICRAAFSKAQGHPKPPGRPGWGITRCRHGGLAPLATSRAETDGWVRQCTSMVEAVGSVCSIVVVVV